MNAISKAFSVVKSKIAVFIGRVTWKQKKPIRKEDLVKLYSLLAKDYYIILTRRSNHLSSFAIALAHFFLTRKMGFYSHALMNTENEVKNAVDFRLVSAIEATEKGVHYSTFAEVFEGIDCVALLKPKCLSTTDWTAILDKARAELGKPYDTLFDLKNDMAMSCVEVVRCALQAHPDYATDFAKFEEMIAKAKNLDPQMFYECPDFEVVFERRMRSASETRVAIG